MVDKTGKRDVQRAGPPRAGAAEAKGGGSVDKKTGRTGGTARAEASGGGVDKTPPANVAETRYGEPRTGDNGTTYLRKWIRCGKEGCKCARGEPHGPFWYAFLRDAQGKQRARYIGKHFKRIPAAAWERKRKGKRP